MKCGKILSLHWAAFLGLVALTPVSAQAQSVRINRLSDVAFGTISNFTIDQRISQNICVFTTPLGTLYRVTATGSGTGGGFSLVSGASTMAYEVEWAATTGQTTGTSLTSGVALTNLTTAATTSGCNSIPTRSASLIIVLRTAVIGAAKSGSYTGVLTLLVAPN